MLSREYLESRVEMFETQPVRLFQRQTTAWQDETGSPVPYDTERPILFGKAEVDRPLTESDTKLFDEVEATLARRLMFIWPHTATAPWQENFDPRAIEIRTQDIIKLEDGSEWTVRGATGEMRRTRWRCPAVRYEGKPIIS